MWKLTCVGVTYVKIAPAYLLGIRTGTTANSSIGQVGGDCIVGRSCRYWGRNRWYSWTWKTIRDGNYSWYNYAAKTQCSRHSTRLISVHRRSRDSMYPLFLDSIRFWKCLFLNDSNSSWIHKFLHSIFFQSMVQSIFLMEYQIPVDYLIPRFV